jgi:hypothetical protein
MLNTSPSPDGITRSHFETAGRVSELEDLRFRVTGKRGVTIIGGCVKLSVSTPGALYRSVTQGGRKFSKEIQRLIRADLAIADHIN